MCFGAAAIVGLECSFHGTNPFGLAEWQGEFVILQ
jgi:hypothetical protein